MKNLILAQLQMMEKLFSNLPNVQNKVQHKINYHRCVLFIFFTFIKFINQKSRNEAHKSFLGSFC